MTIVMWIHVHPYMATHFAIRKSMLHVIAFMILDTDSVTVWLYWTKRSAIADKPRCNVGKLWQK